VKSRKFANFLLDEITSDSVHPVNQGVCAIMHLENVKSTIEGIILTGSVADFFGKQPICYFFLRKSVMMIWQQMTLNCLVTETSF
jgi:hypothetical protein